MVSNGLDTKDFVSIYVVFYKWCFMNKNDNSDVNNNQSVKSNEKETNLTPPSEIKIDPNTQKFIPLTPISSNLKNQITRALETFLQVRQDFSTKKLDLANKRQLIKEKISSLTETKKVNLDKNEFEKTEKIANDYIKLLDSIINELTNEIGYYYIFISNEKPPFEKIVVPLSAPDSLENYLEIQISGAKRYLKNVKRDISISFSRYSFGCDEQLKHLSFVESYLKSKESIKKQKDEPSQKQ